MSAIHRKPTLLVDVDGVISLFGFDGQPRPPGAFLTVDGIPHFVSAQAGEALAMLAHAFEPAWCSGWEERANEYLPAALGLPGPLPYLSFDAAPRNDGAHWKLAAIDAYVGRYRALAWIDDDHSGCEAWAAGRDGPTLLVTTTPAIGLTSGHVDELLSWVATLP